MEQLSSPPEDTRLNIPNHSKNIHCISLLLSSSSIVHDYQKQIDQLQEKLSQKEDEQISLSERFNEVDLELRKAVNDHASAMVKYQSLVEQQTLHAEDR
jgi:flagellar biosynthesis chaperone FliJ